MQFDLRSMFEHMGGVAWAVVIVLTIMSVWSIAVMIERYWTFKKATDQSRKYAPDAARMLKSGKLKEAIDASHHMSYKYSHLAKVLGAGLQEWQYQSESGEAAKDKEAAAKHDQLSAILDAVGKVGELELEDVEPTSHPLDVVNVLDEDEPAPSLPLDEALHNAPDPEDGFFGVPAV